MNAPTLTLAQLKSLRGAVGRMTPEPWISEDLGPCDGIQISSQNPTVDPNSCVVSDSGDLSEDDGNGIALLVNNFDALAAAAEEAIELKVLFDMQWKRMGEATDLWRAEDPKERELISPDLGDLLKWLMDRAAAAERVQEAAYYAYIYIPTGDPVSAAARNRLIEALDAADAGQEERG